MTIHRTLMPHEVIKNREMQVNSIVAYLDNGNILVCNCANFKHSCEGEMCLLIWLASQKKWVKTYAKDKYTKAIWDFYQKQPKRKKNYINFAAMMRHDRVHK